MTDNQTLVAVVSIVCFTILMSVFIAASFDYLKTNNTDDPKPTDDA